MLVPSRTDYVHALLRGELRTGHRWPGSPISVKDTAVSLRVSPTPVREALERLVGEGLVTPTGSKAGFQVARLGVAGLAQTIDLHGTLALAGHIRIRGQRRSEPPLPLDDDPVAATETVFGVVFWERANTQLAFAAARMTVLLAPYRVHEPKLFPNWRAELGSIAMALSGERASVAAMLRAYHRRRAGCAAAMISASEEARDQRRDGTNISLI